MVNQGHSRDVETVVENASELLQLTDLHELCKESLAGRFLTAGCEGWRILIQFFIYFIFFVAINSPDHFVPESFRDTSQCLVVCGI